MAIRRVSICLTGFILAAIVQFSGCAKSSAAPQTGAQVKTAPAKPTATDESAEPLPEQTEPVALENEGAVTLKLLNWEQTGELIKSKKGKIVVVDFWATYCPPCVKEFPNLVKLHAAHSDQIACISVSTDYEGDKIAKIDEVKEPVLDQLKTFGATFDNVLMNITAEEFSKKIKIPSVPIVMVFDKDGKQVAIFPDPKNPDEFTYAKDVLPVVNKLLAAP
jgi:thiol-disulfide isomerase/thioredoxin